MFISAKNTLSRHQPTNPDPGSVSTTSVQNKQPPAPNASNQNNQSMQTGVKKFSSPKRTPTRHSAAKDFSVWRRAGFIIAPKTGSKKLVETWRPERDLDCRLEPGRTVQKFQSVIVPAQFAVHAESAIETAVSSKPQVTHPPSGPSAESHPHRTNHICRLCCSRALWTEQQRAQLDSASEARCSAVQSVAPVRVLPPQTKQDKNREIDQIVIVLEVVCLRPYPPQFLNYGHVPPHRRNLAL